MFASSIFNDTINALPRCKAKCNQISNYIEKNLVQTNWRLFKNGIYSFEILKFANYQYFDTIIVSIPPQLPGNRFGESINTIEISLVKKDNIINLEKIGYSPNKYFYNLSDFLCEIIYLINYSG